MMVTIKNGHLIDPSQGIDCLCDIIIENGKISGIQQLEPKDKGHSARDKVRGGKGETVIDAEGRLVIPGLIDMHVHLREPGFEYKETIQTGTAAAARGGVTSVCCMPNTSPVNDNAVTTAFILARTRETASCDVFPIGAITKGQKGEELAEMGIMREAGCIAFSDDGRPVMDSLLMRRALEYSKILDVPVIAHCEDLTLAAGGVMNEGLLSVTMGLRGIPPQAEEIMIGRDIALAELTGGRLHIAHVSTKGSVELLRQAKQRGIARVTAETCPHYFHITEEEVRGYNTNAKVNPPLRTRQDVEAIREGLRDGTIDVIATDHAPHHADEKRSEFDNAPSGISGLETLIGLSMKLVDDGVLNLSGLIEKMTAAPARILGLKDKGCLRPGSDADLVILGTKNEYTVNPEGFVSKGKNSPFAGWLLHRAPAVTIAQGRIYRWD
ncbi:MAG: dihydroorotase [Nitrospiraceae bacterium]|nr:dihydroorotase [Nitrospiraceae bacterium]